jgi:hypothetical protein
MDHDQIDIAAMKARALTPKPLGGGRICSRSRSIRTGPSTSNRERSCLPRLGQSRLTYWSRGKIAMTTRE